MRQVLVRSGVVLGVLGALLVPSLPSPASAAGDATVVVRGTDLPVGGPIELSYVGCARLYERTAEVPQPFVGLGPDQAPAGERSLRYDLAGGTALGSLSYARSMASTTTSGLSVQAPRGAAGVAWVGYQEPADFGTTTYWFGRADVSAPAGAWTSVETTGLTYTWSRYDMATRRAVGGATAAPSTLAAMIAERGDGPGFRTVGFGCDGNRFALDALRVGDATGTTTYDLEGLTTTTVMAARPAPRGTVLTGVLRDGSGEPVVRGTLVLERQVAGGWETVQVVPAEAVDATVTVAPEQTTTYRWRFADRPLAEGSVSEPTTVTVAPGQETSQQPAQQPAQQPTRQPAQR